MVWCSPLWSTRMPDHIPTSWVENPDLNQIVYAYQLIRYFRSRYGSWSSIPENVATLAGLRSTIQIELTQPLSRWLTFFPPDELEPIPSLFCLLGTLDEPKAVIEVQRAFREFLTLPHLESNLDAAREALAQLEMTARKPEFIYKALSIPDYA
ncbi:hypothetical protein C8J56DRAFT_976927 [Mycena floridula]|nr:hypothetical protein C8J56DRAFT_976927 [Mycena floridula]